MSTVVASFNVRLTGYLVPVIIWLDGGFAAGKTTLAREPFQRAVLSGLSCDLLTSLGKVSRFHDSQVVIMAAMAGWRRSLSRQRLRYGPMLPTAMPSLALISA
jgi:hypothetical protein